MSIHSLKSKKDLQNERRTANFSSNECKLNIIPNGSWSYKVYCMLSYIRCLNLLLGNISSWLI